MAQAGAPRNQKHNMRRIRSEDIRGTPTSMMSGEDISSPVLTNVTLFRPVRREGTGEYDLAQLESSLVLRFPLYDLHNNSQTNLKSLLSHQSSKTVATEDHPLSREDRPLSREDHPLPRVDRPLSREDRPLSREDHPLSREDRPLPRVDRPLSREDRPLSREDHPLSREDRPLSREDRPLPHEDHPLSREDRPLSREDRPLSREDRPLSHEDRPLSLEKQGGIPSPYDTSTPATGQEYLDEFSVTHSPYARRSGISQPQYNRANSTGRDFENGIKLDNSSEEDQCTITSEVPNHVAQSIDYWRSISATTAVKTAGAFTEEQAIEQLYNPYSAQTLQETLQAYPTLVNCSAINNEAPIHAIVKMKRKDKLSLLLAMLTNSSADVNIETGTSGLSPLHQAVLEEDEMCVKTLISFGANIRSTDLSQHTPLQVCSNTKIIDLLEAVEASLIKPDTADESCEVYKRKETLMEYIRRRGEPNICDELEEATNQILSLSLSHSLVLTDSEAAAITFQKREIARFKKTNPHIPHVLRKGDRILCLDGGGMKGLAQIEVLSQLEEATGQKITELFDWIVGTSTGAIIALAMVYVRKTLPDLRRLYFQLKEKVFGSKGPNNSQALEGILRSTFGTEMMMNDVEKPKILIGAVDKSTTNLQFYFFNNCFGDQFSQQPVWKVARYTSAAPLYFTEFENYVDGGVLANNPCEYALTAIQNYYREQKIRPPISLLVSVGSGVYPALKLGNIDAQQFLYFGIHTFRLDVLKDRASNLISLLSNALVESEAVAKNCKSRCEEQGILFYRFSPKLDEVIGGGETDSEKLINMLIQTKLQAKGQGLEELVQLLRDFRQNHS